MTMGKNSLELIRARVMLSLLGLFLGMAITNICAAEARKDLPFAEGHDFASLDAYLKHLADRGPIGVPFYREVAPGQFERQVQMLRPGEKPQRLSRADLAKRYGFPADQ
jgi:hypothetical protein